MKNIPLLVGTILGTVILIIVVAMVSSGGSSTTGQDSQVADISVVMGDARHRFVPLQMMPEDQEKEIDAENITDATDSAEQDENQEIVSIVEFSDFQCPACKAALPAVEKVKEIYAGKIQIIYRHFPLDSLHPNARLAAIASEAVTSLDENQFWPFHDKLFLEQQTWSQVSSRNELKDTFATYASELGIDRTKFLEKMDDNSIVQLVNTDVAAGTQLGVNSTPTFYVNGIKTSAPQLITTVESVLIK